MATILVCHGAWSGGWSWKRMRGPMAARGHELLTPTYTGLGERSHLASPAIDLETHVADILSVLEYEDLGDLVLLGHSYGGMVATAVADRAPERVKSLIYLDAFVPEDAEWLTPLRNWMPFKAFLQRLRLTGGGAGITGAYIHCTRKTDEDPFAPMAARIRARSGWRVYEMDAGHTPNITAPEALADLLDRIIAGDSVG
ncbi:MAG: alpha/beta hydrolase [Bauldia litoralis]|uniref:alpha/beta fold hydrolase n=1 Tax=Bauldia litoralis TaxID=665467 RepID=UPI003299FAFF